MLRGYFTRVFFFAHYFAAQIKPKKYQKIAGVLCIGIQSKLRIDLKAASKKWHF
jgi:hypothetical protein